MDFWACRCSVWRPSWTRLICRRNINVEARERCFCLDRQTHRQSVMSARVPGRDYCLGLQDSDRPSGSPDWLWRTGWDPPTPDALPDCSDRTHQPGRRPVRGKKKKKLPSAAAKRQYLSNKFLPYCINLVSTVITCPAASVRPHKALEADPTQSPKAVTSPFLQFIEIPAIDSPRT